MTLLLDGGMGQELRARGLNPDANNAGRALLDAPQAVQGVHEEFIHAGAEIITTWNYSVTRQRLGNANQDGTIEEMTEMAVKIADDARKTTGKSNVRIAGCLPPLRASYEPNDQEFMSMIEEYSEIADHLSSGVDLFLCETMSSAREAAAAAEAASKFGKPVWVSWTLQDEANGLLRSGETIEEALAAIDQISVEAVLFNCCDITAIEHAMSLLRGKTTRLIGAYANAFTPIAQDWKRDGNKLRDLKDLTPEEYAEQALSWCKNGAEIIGGCCNIGPAHISQMRDLIDKNILTTT